MNEQTLLADIIRNTGSRRADLITGPGDDCAVVSIPGSGYDWLLKCDPVVEGIHFNTGTDPVLIGRKAVNRVFSDIAAMGGEPLWILSSIIVPENHQNLLPALLKSISETAARANAAVAGGDLSRGDKLTINISAVGRAPEKKAVLRSGAALSDHIYVTGTLGGSIRGKHLKFEPRLAEGQWLMAGGWVSAMIDVSDGLASDLRHIINAGNTGALLNLENIPVSPEAHAMQDGKTPLSHALCDGEDFELLFTVRKTLAHDFAGKWASAFETPCTHIGEISGTAGQLLYVDRAGGIKELAERGFDHFESGS